MTKLSDLLKKRDELAARERELSEVNAEIAAIEAAQAAKEQAEAERERQTAIAAVCDVVADAERECAELVTDLDAALDALDLAEGELRALTGKPVGKRVSANLRAAVNAELGRWARWSPELVGMPARTVPTPEERRTAALEDARRDVKEAHAYLRRGNLSTPAKEAWQTHAEACESRLALLEGRSPTDAELNPERDAATREMHEARRASLTGIPDAAGQLLVGIAQKRAEKGKAADGDRP